MIRRPSGSCLLQQEARREWVVLVILIWPHEPTLAQLYQHQAQSQAAAIKRFGNVAEIILCTQNNKLTNFQF